MRILLVFLLISTVFSQYLIVKRGIPKILKVYSPPAYVENPYSVKVFVLNNGTGDLVIYSYHIDDGVHNWTSEQREIIIPPGYLGILEARTNISCEDFGESFLPVINISTSGGKVSGKGQTFFVESPIEIVYPLAIAGQVGSSKRKIITFINKGERSVDLIPVLRYPTDKMFVIVLSNNYTVPPGIKNFYIDVVPYYSGYLGEVNISFPLNCSYLISPTELFIKVKGIYEEELGRRVLLAPEVNMLSFLIFFVISLIIGRAAGI